MTIKRKYSKTVKYIEKRTSKEYYKKIRTSKWAKKEKPKPSNIMSFLSTRNEKKQFTLS
jgi:hypothetical protein